MVLRPYVLRHPGDHAQHEAERAVEPLGVEQAAMPAFVHQGKCPQSEQADSKDCGGGEPVGNVDTPQSDAPENRERRQRRKYLYQCPNIVGARMSDDDVVLLFFYAAYRRHERRPQLRVTIGSRWEKKSGEPSIYAATKMVTHHWG